MLADRRVLVTGGSGTIGARLVERLFAMDTAVVRVFGRDETKQFYQRQRHTGRRDLRFLIGDIRDRDRLTRAMEGIDVVFHCAALKHVESGEYNPFEATQTNIVGTQNVIDACLAAVVRTMILTSSDKAANPTNVMGATKLLAEKLVTAASNYRGPHRETVRERPLRQRPGSRGSALELFASQIAAGGPVTMTDPAMTRFVMSTDRAVELASRRPRSPVAARSSCSRCPSRGWATSSRRPSTPSPRSYGLDPADIAHRRSRPAPARRATKS